jgi:hypothetical protein
VYLVGVNQLHHRQRFRVLGRSEPATPQTRACCAVLTPHIPPNSPATQRTLNPHQPRTQKPHQPRTLSPHQPRTQKPHKHAYYTQQNHRHNAYTYAATSKRVLWCVHAWEGVRMRMYGRKCEIRMRPHLHIAVVMFRIRVLARLVPARPAMHRLLDAGRGGVVRSPPMYASYQPINQSATATHLNARVESLTTFHPLHSAPLRSAPLLRVCTPPRALEGTRWRLCRGSSRRTT